MDKNPDFPAGAEVKKIPALPEEDPGFASLVSSIPADYADSQGGWSDPAASDAYDSFMGEGWENADDGLPW